MNEFLSSNIVPRVELLERQTRELQARLEGKPNLAITISSGSVDALVADLDKIYRNFSKTCNLDIKIVIP